MSDILQQYVNIVPSILEVMDIDAMMAITDGEKFLGYFPGKTMKADITVNEALPKTDPMWEVFQTGKKIVSTVPEEVYGFAFKSISAPIREAGHTIGTIGFAISLEKDNHIKKSFHDMQDKMDTIHKDITDVRSFNDTVGSEVTAFSELLSDISDNFQIMKKAAEGIRSIASQSNILSLNASIEAARAGEHGRGFTIVAQQMQTHSNHTKESSESVLKTLNQIHEDVTDVNKNLITLKKSFDNQSIAIDGMSQTLSALQNLSDALDHYIETH